MSVKAIDLKNWCSEHISPLAWSRIVLRVLPGLREIGHDLDTIENPSGEMMLSDRELSVIQAAMQQLYEMEIPSEVVSN